MRKWLWLIGLLVGVTVGSILVISYTAEPVYKATVLFQVTSPPPGEVTLYKEFKSPTLGQQLGQTEADFIQIVQSLDVAWQTIKALGIEMEAESFLKTVTIKQSEGGSPYTKLSVTADNPQLAASLANTLMETALKYFGSLRAKSFTRTREFINQQLEEARSELNKAQNDLIQFQIKNKVSSLDALIGSQQSLIRQLNFERDQALAKGDMELASNYDQIIAKRQRELQELLGLSSEYDDLRAAVDRASTTYYYLLDRETEAKLKENELSNVDFIQVLPAREPSRPLPRLNPKDHPLGSHSKPGPGNHDRFLSGIPADGKDSP